MHDFICKIFNTTFIKRLFLLCLISTSISYAQNEPNWKIKEHKEQYIKAIELLNDEKYDESLVTSRKLLQNAILAQDNKATGYAYNAIAANFDALTEPDKALFYYKKSLMYAEKINDSNLLNWVYNNLGNIYCFDNKDYLKGISYYVNSLKYSGKIKDSSQIVFTQLNIAWAYFDIDEYGKGAPYLNFVNKFHDKHGDDSTLTTLKLLNGMYATHTNDNLAAKKYFQSAIKEGIKQNEESDLSFTYQEYSKFLFKNKQPELAYRYLTKYDSLKDKIRTDEKRSKTNITGINLQIDEYKRELDKTESLYRHKEEMLEYEKSRNKRVVAIMVSLFIISIILFYFFFQNTKLKQKNKLKDVQRKIQDNLINASIDGQERERIAIAGFLHDNISAMLSSAGMHLKSIGNANEELPEEIIKTKAILEEAHDRVRDLSHELLPTLLVRFGLFYAIEDLCEKNSNSKIQLEYLSNVATKTRYNQKFEMRLYFIISELLNNITKHSNASKAHVSIDLGNHELLFHVHDNGQGFDSKKFKVEGFGLNQIRARIKNLNGEFNVNSKVNYGTSVKMKVPILY